MRSIRHLTLAVLAAAATFLFGLGAPLAAQDSVDDPAQVEAGRAVYETNCSGCHGATGQGSDLGRPLFDIVSQGDRAQHVDSVTNGKGPTMPAFGGSLDDDEIESVVSFVRIEFAAEVDEAAAEAAELAVTGPTDSAELAILGVVLLLTGGLVLGFARSTRSQY